MDELPVDSPAASQPPSRWLSLLWLARVFVVLVCLSLLTLDFWQSRNAYDARKREGSAFAANLVSSLAQHAQATFKQADTILLDLVERVETDGTGKSNLLRLESLMARHVKELPKLHGLYLYNADGRWLANSRRIRSQTVNNADRDYFQYLRLDAGPQPFIGQPIRSRSTGEWILTIARRISDSHGRFAGVALATIRLDYFRQMYESYQIGQNGTIALEMLDGTLLLRLPFDERQIGMNVRDAVLFCDHLPKAPAGSFYTESGAFDHRERLVSYQRLESYPLVQIVTQSRQDLVNSWWQETYPRLLVVCGLTLALGFLGFRMLRQLARRLETEQELQQAQTTLQRLNRELEKMAMQDGLTGLANRRQFDLALNDEFNRAQRNHQSLALLMFDVDDFKQFNDRYGHPAGDDCLRRISAAIKSYQRRPGDLAARYGGEEIALLLPGTDLDGARSVAEQVCQGVRGLQIAHSASDSGILSVSCGVDALVPVRNRDLPHDLLEGADKALYAAKSAGRDQLVVAPRRDA